MFNKLWSFLKEIHYDQRGGTGTAVSTGDIITSAKMNLKLEEIVNADLVHDSGVWTIGESGAGQDITFYTDVVGRIMLWDPSDSSLELGDNVIIAFGAGDDVEIYWNATNLIIMPAMDDVGAIIIGDGTNKSMDFLWYGSTVNKYVQFDLGADKVTFEDVDLYLGDNDMLVFGDGADVTIKWDASKLLIDPAAEFNLVMNTYHFCLETLAAGKTLRINSRTYVDTASESIIGFQCKPRAGNTRTASIYGAEMEPGLNDTFGGTSLIGFASRPILEGTTGDLSGDVRAYEASIGSDSGSSRTIAGVASALWVDNNFYGTVTGGVYVIHVPNPGGGTVSWSGLLNLVDDGGNLADLASAVATVVGAIKVKIGSQVGYLPVYSGYTPT